MPAFGSPTSPASAISFSRSQSVRSTPSCPGLALRGAWLVEDLKRRLPQPPLPPLRQRHPLPGRVRSATSVSPSSSRISVPTGTFSTTSGALRPVRCCPDPGWPFLAKKCCW